MGRPKLPITRNRQFNIGLTEKELSDIQRAARLAGMRPVDYGRARILAKLKPVARTAIAVRQLDPLLLLELSRLGNNLNQIARKLNEFAIPAPDVLASLLAEIRALIRLASEP